MCLSLLIQRAELTLKWCLVPLFIMVPGVRYFKKISSARGTSVAAVMVGRWEVGEVGWILKCGSPSLTGSIVAVLLAPLSLTSLSLSPSLSIIATLLSLSSSVSAIGGGSTMEFGDGAGATCAASPFVTYSSISFTLSLSRGERS